LYFGHLPSIPFILVDFFAGFSSLLFTLGRTVLGSFPFVTPLAVRSAMFSMGYVFITSRVSAGRTATFALRFSVVRITLPYHTTRGIFPMSIRVALRRTIVVTFRLRYHDGCATAPVSGRISIRLLSLVRRRELIFDDLVIGGLS